MSTTKSALTRANIDYYIFIPAILFILGLAIPIGMNPGAAEALAGDLIAAITRGLGWLYLIGALAVFLFLLWLALGPYGRIRLGRPQDKPDFSKFNWLAMMFCAGMGSSIMNYAFAEPIYFMQGPALGFKAGSNQAAEYALMYSFFHWGIIAYGIYLLPAIPIAYMVFVKRANLFRLSEAFVGVLGDKAYGPVGKIIDVLVILGIIGGTATTLGLSVPVLSTLFSGTFGVPNTFGLQVFVLALWTAIFTWSVYQGLSKGIQVLSRINVLLALALLAFVFLTGPTLFILDLTTDSLGLLATNFFRMALWTDPIDKSGYPQAWTIFYWAWWLAYAPMVGLFTARISKGRTIRELILYAMVYGSVGSWVFFAVWGGYSIFAQTTGALDLSSILAANGMPATILAAVQAQPLGKIFMFLFLILFMVFTATTMDSSAYVLASMSSRRLDADEEPSRLNRITWAVILGITAIAMLMMGGLKAVQSSSIVLATPLVFLMALLVVSLMRMLKADYGIAVCTRHFVLQPSGEVAEAPASEAQPLSSLQPIPAH
ncbi:choline transporter (plasmid) [Aminobacter sp. Y103A]|uniref:BCCT family transporter n=1 Tax=Aminobacter sp. Y103A TaxID=1870862 RepID=UPI002573CA6C|nr:BCCT family transporter [Aminobacter sp. SS-2016]BBD41086.1 choline transporter [Aminobacter sp. SS-2016]